MKIAHCYKCGWNKVLADEFVWDPSKTALACPTCGERVTQDCLDCTVQVLKPYNRCDACTSKLCASQLRAREIQNPLDYSVLNLTTADRQFLAEMRVGA